MKILGYNKERRKSNASFYLKAMGIGALLGVGLLTASIGIIELVKLGIKYWIFLVVMIAALYLLKRFLFPRPVQMQLPHGYR